MPEDRIKRRKIEEVDLNLINISKDNVRHELQNKNLEELKTSIQRIGLIHPVILIQKKDKKFELLVGQRRFLAFKQLNEKTIPAIIINDLDPISRKIVSLTENIHRRDLPYSDTIKICDELFNKYTGNEKERIQKIANEIGISIVTVSKYLSYRLVPQRVQDMVEDDKITANQAYQITSAFWPNISKIEEIAKYTSKVAKPTWERALSIGRKKPQASVDEIIEEASRPLEKYKVSLSLDPEMIKILDEETKKREKASKKKITVQDLILELIEDFISNRGG